MSAIPLAPAVRAFRRSAGLVQAAIIGRAALVFAAVMLAYLPAIRAGFIWNDRDYVTKPELQSVAGLGRIWFELGATEQYYPVLHTAFWLEHRLWGDAAVGYHLLNVLLHATSACLLALILRRLAMPGAWLAAFLFALHPVCVESVAWIAEQKNTLATALYLASLLVYLDFDRHRARSSYLLASGLFLLALLSKSVTATLPAALLVIFWWQRGRFAWRRDLRPLLPWLAAGAAFGLFSGWVERTYIGARGADFALTLVERTVLAGRAFWFYLAKLVWPADLIFIYPRWRVDATEPWQWLFPLGGAALLAGLWVLRRRIRAPLAALLFFGGSLFPVLGFFNVYAFVFSFVADHWQYQPSLGPIVLAAAGAAWWMERQALPARRTGGALAAVLLAVLGVLTWRQCGLYRDMETFYRRTLAANPACWMAHNNLAILLIESGRSREALPHLEQAARARPDDPEPQNNLGNALTQAGRPQEAVAHLERALELAPHYAEAEFNLGRALAGLGRPGDAMAHYEQALRDRPGYAEAENNLGNLLLAAGRAPEAAAHFATALRSDPKMGEAEYNLALALTAMSRTQAAVPHYEAALRGNPANAEIHYHLAIALTNLQRTDEAIAQFQEAIRLRPDWADAHLKLALALWQAGRQQAAAAEHEAGLRLKSAPPAAHP